MYEQHFVEDGEPAFGIEGTFQIHNRIYILTDEADYRLLNHLGDLGYKIGYDNTSAGYIAGLTHHQTKNEILDEIFNAQGKGITSPSSIIIDMTYTNKPRISLENTEFHNLVLSAASQRRDLGYYNRPHDQIGDVAISRMSGFVKNIVDVDVEMWQKFVVEARQYHTQDFIRRMAHWASSLSDKSDRRVYGGKFASDEIISGTQPFGLTKPLPIPLFGRPFPL